MDKGSTKSARSLSTARPGRRKFRWLIALVALTAVVMGAPTIRGGFVGADDQRLVLNHVLVNHPSITHAVELFRIVHRDLYQPLPLLSFQVEFAIANLFGFFDESIKGGVWLFHLTNILLHALNAVFVWLVMVSLLRKEVASSRYLLATAAALLFAVHPLQTEVVAWVNGRMMLMSTLFALVSLVTIDRWLQTGRLRWALWTVLFVTFCAISKIRIGLPVLLFVMAIARGPRLSFRFYGLWLACAAITVFFVKVNLTATEDAGMFTGARDQLQGSRIARSVLALAWYFRHMLWPTGLASWYPTPGLVQWSDPAVHRAAFVVLFTLAIAVWTIRLRRESAYGWLWFLATIASTLPLVPARNTLAADRYMYLPIIGLAFVAALMWQTFVTFLSSRGWRATVKTVSPWFGMALTAAMIATSWHTAGFYESATSKSRRIADMFPTTPHVWERVAWALFDERSYEGAIVLARKEFAFEDIGARSMALHVIGRSQFGLGEKAGGLASVREAIGIDSRNSKAKYTLGKMLDDLGRTDEALFWIEASVQDAPSANPRIIRLANLYRRLGRPADARRSFEQAIENNPYEVPAVQALVKLDIHEGTEESLGQARRRLIDLLDWMAENADAWTDLGVVESSSGRTERAIAAYKNALQRDSTHATAALNLALLYQGRDELNQVNDYLSIAAAGRLDSLEQVIALHDALVAYGRPGETIDVWKGFLREKPDSSEGRLFAAWASVLAGDVADVNVARLHADLNPPHPMAYAILAYAALLQDQFESAENHVERLCTGGAPAMESRRRLLGALESFFARQPESPWTFCLTARLLVADGRTQAAEMAIEMCRQRCKAEACRQYVKRTMAILTPLGS